MLWVSVDMCRFSPPGKVGLPIHWDHDPHDEQTRFIQGVVALTDTEIGQGGWRCVPSLWQKHEAWPTEPVVSEWGDEWKPEVAEGEIVEVPAAKGDLIVWDSRLAHANSTNDSDRPRIAFYVNMNPPEDEEMRGLRIECYQQGLCLPWWRWHGGADRAEPWPPAALTELGQRLLGLDRWPGEGTVTPANTTGG